jgi:small subunit ribosomal protein S2
LNITITELLEAGVHFGHQTKRWNPKMKPYIYQERAGIYIINLQKSLEELKKACEVVSNVAARGGKILFVGTKRQAKQTIKELAFQTGNYYVTERWLGGMLTNNATIRASVEKLQTYEKWEKDGTFEKITKKELSLIQKEKEKLHRNLDGIRDMVEDPALVFIIDIKREALAVAEARKLHIPIVAIVDTNCDPDLVDYVIPGNDDAIRSITYILSKVQEAIKEGGGKYEQVRMTREKKEAEHRKEAPAGEAPARKKEGDSKGRFKPARKPHPEKHVEKHKKEEAKPVEAKEKHKAHEKKKEEGAEKPAGEQPVSE